MRPISLKLMGKSQGMDRKSLAGLLSPRYQNAVRENLNEIGYASGQNLSPPLGLPTHPIKYKSTPPRVNRQGVSPRDEATVGDFLESYARTGDSSNLMEQAVRIDKEKSALNAFESNRGLSEGEVLGTALTRLGHGTSSLIKEAEDTGSVVGLLRRQEQIREAAGGSVSQIQKGSLEEAQYVSLSNKISEMNEASYLGVGEAKSRSQAAYNRLYSEDAYDEAVHMRNNTATSTNAMSGSTSGPIPPSSSNTPINTATTSTGSTSYSGYYQPGETPSSSELLGSMSQDGASGVMSSMAFGAAIGGAANYAMGGEFGEGAMMGGIAGGGIKIGARAIQQNQASIENFLQRTALGDAGQNITRDQAATAIQGMSAAPEGAGLMQRGAFNILKSENPSLGMQSRYMVMGGSALSGVMFTGSRKDKRRGFNAHRGNRI